MKVTDQNVLTALLSAVLALGLVLGAGLDPFGWVFSSSEKEAATSTQALATSFATATVGYVFDGDTIKATHGSTTESVRLVGVDTPEMNWPQDEAPEAECFAPEAREYLKSKVLGKTVRLVSDDLQPARDKYDRRLAYVYSGRELVNRAIVENGYGRLLVVGPGFSKQDEFSEIANEARTQSRGLWGACAL